MLDFNLKLEIKLLFNWPRYLEHIGNWRMRLHAL